MQQPPSASARRCARAPSTACPARAPALCAAAAALAMATAASAQPTWSYQGAQVGQLTATAHANAFQSGGAPNPQDSSDVELGLNPGFAIGPDTYDFGNEARAVAISVSDGPCSASALSVTGIRGLGTPVIEVYYRVSTLDDASFPSYGYESTSEAVANLLYALNVAGGIPGEAYSVTCDYEYFGNAFTQADAGFDDFASSNSEVVLLSGQIGAPISPYSLNYSSITPPTGSGGTITGSIGSVAKPNLDTPLPDIAHYFVGINTSRAADTMASPGSGGGNQDLCGAEFEARLTFTIAGICPKPTIAQHPSSTNVCPNGQATLMVDAPAPGNTFQWQITDPGFPGQYFNIFDGPLVVGGNPVGTVSGTSQGLLTFTPSVPGPLVLPSMRCMVLNACNGRASNAASIAILPPNHPNCPACDSIDFNHDDLFPDTQDIDDFLSVFSGGPCSNDPLCGDIDFNNDTLFPDTLDIDALLSVFSGGPCL